MDLFFIILSFLAVGANLAWCLFLRFTWLNLIAAVWCFGCGCFLLSKYRRGS